MTGALCTPHWERVGVAARGSQPFGDNGGEAGSPLSFPPNVWESVISPERRVCAPSAPGAAALAPQGTLSEGHPSSPAEGPGSRGGQRRPRGRSDPEFSFPGTWHPTHPHRKGGQVRHLGPNCSLAQKAPLACPGPVGSPHRPMAPFPRQPPLLGWQRLTNVCIGKAPEKAPWAADRPGDYRLRGCFTFK